MNNYTTNRGFNGFAQGHDIRVQESSVAFTGAHCWIFHNSESEGRNAVHLSVVQAKVAIAGLQQFVAAAEANELTEPAEPPTEE